MRNSSWLAEAVTTPVTTSESLRVGNFALQHFLKVAHFQALSAPNPTRRTLVLTIAINRTTPGAGCVIELVELSGGSGSGHTFCVLFASLGTRRRRATRRTTPFTCVTNRCLVGKTHLTQLFTAGDGTASLKKLLQDWVTEADHTVAQEHVVQEVHLTL